MNYSLGPLLIHHELVPVAAREALKAAYSGPAELKAAALETAARVLYRDTDLECEEVRELVGLPTTDCCQ